MNQKGFTQTLLIPIVLVALIFGFFFVKNYSTKSNSTPGSPTSQESTNKGRLNELFNKVDTEQYTFYYPKDFVETQNPKYKDSTLYSPKEMPEEYKLFGYGLVLNITRNAFDVKDGDRDLSNIGLDFCNELAKKEVTRSTQKIDYVKVIKKDDFGGCLYKITTPLKGSRLEDEGINLMKEVYTRKAANPNIYRVSATYFGSEKEENVEAMERSVEMFELK